jgi:hypothetical protein
MRCSHVKSKAVSEKHEKFSFVYDYRGDVGVHVISLNSINHSYGIFF